MDTPGASSSTLNQRSSTNADSNSEFDDIDVVKMVQDEARERIKTRIIGSMTMREDGKLFIPPENVKDAERLLKIVPSEIYEEKGSVVVGKPLKNLFTPTKELSRGKSVDSASVDMVQLTGLKENKPLPDVHAVEVLVLNNLLSDSMDKFYDNLRDRLKDCAINLKKIEANCLQSSDQQVIAICNFTTRLEGDIKNTLHNICNDKYRQLFLIVVHCKDKENLPKLDTKSYIETEDEFKDIKEVVDMAFYKKSGIYDCPMNEKAFKKIMETFYIGKDFELL